MSVALPGAFVLAASLAGAPVAAQFAVVDGSAAMESLSSRFRVDFAIPDAPAFALLPVEPGTILRPAGVRDIAMAVSDFAGPEGFRLPNAIAVELSPALLIEGRRLSLATYQSRAWLYRLRVSGGTQRSAETGRVTQLALGLRASLLDRSDLRTNPEYVTQATTVAEEVNEIVVAARLRAGPPPAPVILSAEEKARIEELNRQLRETWADDRWNEDVLDVAAGARAASPGEGGEDLRMTEYAAWASYGKGFGAWGQLLFGGKAYAARDSIGNGFDTAVRLGSRLYVGRNFYKAFAEGLVDLGDAAAADWLVQLGGEVRFMESFWTTFAAGVEPEAEGGGTRLRARFSLKLGLPDFGAGER